MKIEAGCLSQGDRFQIEENGMVYVVIHNGADETVVWADPVGVGVDCSVWLPDDKLVIVT